MNINFTSVASKRNLEGSSSPSKKLRLEKEESPIEKICGDITGLHFFQIMDFFKDRTDLYTNLRGIFPVEERARVYTLLNYCAASKQPSLLKTILEYNPQLRSDEIVVFAPKADPALLPPPLQCAVKVGDLESVRLLIQAGAKLNYIRDDGFSSPLSTAITVKNLPIIKYLLESGAKITQEELSRAVETENDEIIDLVLFSGVEVNPDLATDALNLFLDSKLHDVDFEMNGKFMRSFIFFREQGAIILPLRLGLIGEPLNLEIIKFIIAHGADVSTVDSEQSGFTPLMHAVAIGSLELVTILLKAGAKVNQRLGEREDLMESALTMACLVDDDFPDCSNLEVVKLLLSYGAESEFKEKKYSPYHVARENGLTEIEAILRVRIAKKNKENKKPNQ